MILQDAIDELIETYNSIDVRIFCVLKDNTWNNIFTLIRFRREKIDELKKQHEKIIEKCGELVETDEFRVGMVQFPIEKWDKIKTDLSNKFICLRDDFAVNFNSAINFVHSVQSPYFSNDKEFVFRNWKSFHGHTEENRSTSFSYNDKLVDKAIKNHFTHFDDYLAGIFEFDKYDFQRNPWIDIFAPVFLKVENIDFDSDKVDVIISAYNQKNLEIAFNFFGDKFRSKAELIDKKINNILLEANEELQKKTITIPLDTANLKNEFELLIIKNKKILLVEERDNISRFWKDRKEFTYPYSAVFEKYVGFDELEKMLFEFKSKHGGDESKIFEKAISWLLSILKLPNILLEKYEKIGGGAEAISTDIISTIDKNTILLINATTRLPKQSDFDRERDFRENLMKQMKNKDIEFLSVYFTGKDATESLQSASNNIVNLIGKTKLKLIIRHLKEGEFEKARNIILNEGI